ncbi:MAG: putative conserved integral rane protein [Ilumatobacteraceae bacterium]|nr:putative conserved integral rane protein [Ilumatobacteraceae bacterium]
MLSWLTLGWLLIDGIIGLSAGLSTNSVVLIGWGIDCGIEAVATLIIIWRFSGKRLDADNAERIAQRVVAVTFLLLVPYIVVEAIDHLITGNAGGISWIGIALAATDAILMPVLGQAKNRIGRQLNSAAATGAGKQNVFCAYLSIAVLIGLGANAILGWWWADPIAALLVAVVCVQAGISTWRGDSCEPLAGVETTCEQGQ